MGWIEAARGGVRHEAGVTVFDVGEQVNGWVEAEIDAEAGTAAEITQGEFLSPDGSVDTSRNLHISDKLQTDLAAGF